METSRFVDHFKIQWAPKWDPNSHVASKNIEKRTTQLMVRCPGTDHFFIESLRIEVLKFVGKLMIDLGTLFCSLVKGIDGFPFILGTLLKKSLENVYS